MINAIVILLTVVLLGSMATYATVPRWFTRSMHRHRLWKLHDAFVWEMLDDHLPRDHPAVVELRRYIFFAVEGKSGQRALDLAVFRWAMKGISPLSQKRVRDEASDQSLDGLTAKQAECLESYRQNFMNLLAGYLMLGSWVGILTVVRFVPPAVAEARRQLRDKPDGPPLYGAHLTMTEATDEAVEQSRRGQRYRAAVERDIAGELALV